MLLALRIIAGSFLPCVQNIRLIQANGYVIGVGDTCSKMKRTERCLKMIRQIVPLTFLSPRREKIITKKMISSHMHLLNHASVVVSRDHSGVSGDSDSITTRSPQTQWGCFWDTAQRNTRREGNKKDNSFLPLINLHSLIYGKERKRRSLPAQTSTVC